MATNTPNNSTPQPNNDATLSDTANPADATLKKPKFKAGDIKLTVKTGSDVIHDVHQRPKKADLIQVMVENKSPHDIKDFGIGYKVGKSRVVFRTSEVHAPLDHKQDRPNDQQNTLLAGETRTITLPRNKPTKYRIGTSISGILPDGERFNKNRSPKTVRSLGQRLMIAAKTGAVVLAAAVGYFGYKDLTAGKTDAPAAPVVSKHAATPTGPNAKLASQYTVKKMEGECILPAGTPLVDHGKLSAKDQKNYKDLRHYVTLPSSVKDCEGVVPAGGKLALPEKVIKATPAPQASATPTRPTKVATNATVKKTHG